MNNVITTVLAEHANSALSGAVTYAPRQLLPLLRVLRAGVPIDNEVHQIARALDKLPGIDWEKFKPAAQPPAVAIHGVRLSEHAVQFWMSGVNIKGIIVSNPRAPKDGPADDVLLRLLHTLSVRRNSKVLTNHVVRFDRL